MTEMENGRNMMAEKWEQENGGRKNFLPPFFCHFCLDRPT
jgi:hypothetical protein